MTYTANLVGGPQDGELIAMKEDEDQIFFYGANLTKFLRGESSPGEEIEYVRHTYVRDPGTERFIYAGETKEPSVPDRP